MEFKQFRDKLHSHIMQMTEGVNHLYTVDVDKDELWELYLNSFPPGTNNIYRERREFDCSHCRQFIKSFGNVVSIKNGARTSIWDVDIDDTVYGPVVLALRDKIHNSRVENVLVTKELLFGTESNREIVEDVVTTWNHFYTRLPERFKYRGRKTEGYELGQYRATKEVLVRSLSEISTDAVDTILELIDQNSLYKGNEWEAVLRQFRQLQATFIDTPADKMDDLLWEISLEVGPVVGRIKNHSIGTLLSNVTEGMELDVAVRKYEQIVAPTNYKRPKAIFTKKMLDDAKKTVVELGLQDSLGRRYAITDDVTINNVLFANRDVKKAWDVDVFDQMEKQTAVQPKSFSRVETVTAEEFVEKVLPTAKNVEVLLENKHSGNLVSLIAPKNKDSKPFFKWDNGFSWAYNGNITDSMKERVKAAGGRVDGVLRFSIQWNDNNDNKNDFDAHCVEPTGHTIYYGNKGRVHPSSGMLDVDIIHPSGVAVENIIYTDSDRMPEGQYKFLVHNFTDRGGTSGFSAEIEFDGQIHSFEYRKPVRNGAKVPVATVTYSKTKGFSIKEDLESSMSSKEVWGVSTNQFVPVTMCMYSPNYWDGQQGIGHKHYFFMLDGCKNDGTPNGFFNEFLREEFMEHKRVFEALGSQLKVEPSDEQLSGIGFSSTKRNELICRVEGATKRVMKIIF